MSETSKLASFNFASVDTYAGGVMTTATRGAGTEASAHATRSVGGGRRGVAPLVVDVQAGDDVHPQAHRRLVGGRSPHHRTFAGERHVTFAATIVEQLIECLAKFAIGAGIHVRVADRVGQRNVPDGVQIFLRQRVDGIHHHSYNLAMPFGWHGLGEGNNRS